MGKYPFEFDGAYPKNMLSEKIMTRKAFVYAVRRFYSVLAEHKIL